MADRRTRRRFTREYKAQAVQRVIESGLPLADIAAELDVSPGQLSQWHNEQLAAGSALRPDGRCADCRTRLILCFFVFDHRPPLALRAEEEDANDPDRLAAICWTCDQQKTPKDLKEIAQ